VLVARLRSISTVKSIKEVDTINQGRETHDREVRGSSRLPAYIDMDPLKVPLLPGGVVAGGRSSKVAH